MTGAIILRREGDVARITIDRAEKRNALTRPMMQALGDAVAAADADPEVGAILLDATGDGFCAGADLANLALGIADGAEDPGARALEIIALARKPLVAAVQGAAVGMGATMLLHFDAIYVTETASLRMPFVDLGLTPEGGATFLLPERIGHLHAAQLLLLCEAMPAERLVATGLATAMVDRALLTETALAAAWWLAALPADIVARTKAMMRGRDVAARLDAEQGAFRETLAGPAFAERVAAVRARLDARR